MLSDDARRKEYDRQLAPPSATGRTVHQRWAAGRVGRGFGAWRGAPPFGSFTDQEARRMRQEHEDTKGSGRKGVGEELRRRAEAQFFFQQGAEVASGSFNYPDSILSHTNILRLSRCIE